MGAQFGIDRLILKNLGNTGFFVEPLAPAKEIVPSYIGTKITSLSDTHYAKKYVMQRGIPQSKMDLLYFCENFALIADKFLKTSVREPRLVIPFFDENKK